MDCYSNINRLNQLLIMNCTCTFILLDIFDIITISREIRYSSLIIRVTSRKIRTGEIPNTRKRRRGRGEKEREGREGEGGERRRGDIDIE